MVLYIPNILKGTGNWISPRKNYAKLQTVKMVQILRASYVLVAENVEVWNYMICEKLGVSWGRK